MTRISHQPSRPQDMHSEPCSRPVLAIGCLGGLSLALGGAVLPLASRKARALLAYLALEGASSVPRERLAGLLWTDVGERQARNSLRQTLFELREVLEKRGCLALRVGREDVALSPEAVELDLDCILAAIAEGMAPELLNIQPAAVDQLLSGYEDLSPLFGEWLAARRRTAQDQLLRALERSYVNLELSRIARRSLAEIALRIDPLHEAACRVAMRLAAEDGELGIALRHYSTLYERLGAELDMEPSAATQELVVEIKQGLVEGKGGVAARAPRCAAWSETVPRVAVLPFRAIGADPVPRWFAEGLVEEVICSLAAMREPIVIAGHATGEIEQTDPTRAGAALGARYVVSGTVRQATGRLRLTVQLTAVEDGCVLWARGFDATDTGLFAAQDAIAANVANTLAPRLQDAELGGIGARPPADLGAYHLVLQARHRMVSLQEGSFAEAGHLLRRAVAIDGRYAAAHAALASWLSLWVGQRWSRDPAGDLKELDATVARAVAADPQNARALSLLGHNRVTQQRRYDDGLRLFQRALELAPNDAAAWLNSCPTYAYIGDGVEAVRRAERALALAPEDPFLFRTYHFLAIGHYVAGDFAAAVEFGQRSMQLNPRYLSNLRLTAGAMVAGGQADEARALAREVMAQQPQFRLSNMLARHPFADAARRNRYEELLLLAGFPA